MFQKSNCVCRSVFLILAMSVLNSASTINLVLVSKNFTFDTGDETDYSAKQYFAFVK